MSEDIGFILDSNSFFVFDWLVACTVSLIFKVDNFKKIEYVNFSGAKK